MKRLVGDYLFCGSTWRVYLVPGCCGSTRLVTGRFPEILIGGDQPQWWLILIAGIGLFCCHAVEKSS